MCISYCYDSINYISTGLWNSQNVGKYVPTTTIHINIIKYLNFE